MPDITFINVPGYTGSGPQHWQSLWENNYENFYRVQQKDWEKPNCVEWVSALDNFISKFSFPIILIGHSIGSIVIINWIATKYRDSVKAVLLVAPADPQNPNFPSQAEGFNNLPLNILPVYSTFVNSSDDPYISMDRAASLAKSWDCLQINIGNCGHINTDSGLGIWPAGKKILDDLVSKIIV